MSILEVKNLKKNFGNVEVLKGIDFSLEKGEALAMIGASGSGKTTLLRCLNFLEKPTEGQILVKGQVIYDSADLKSASEAEIRKNRLHFGMVFQSCNLFPQYTALQNCTLAKELMAKERPDFKSNKKQILEEIREEGETILTSVGLQDKMNNYPHQLSGGQQQRVAIARALMLQPDILCFDEPTSALDPELTGEVLKELSGSCDEFLIHAADVEGKSQGIEQEVVRLLGDFTDCPVTYAGGVGSYEDVKQLRTLGRGHVDVTVGSALDLFGGPLSYKKILELCEK